MSSAHVSQVSCTRCRKRRVKCDRRIPGCERCEKYSQPCPGYSREPRFQDEGPSLRRKFARNSSTHADSLTSSSNVRSTPALLETGTSADSTTITFNVQDDSMVESVWQDCDTTIPATSQDFDEDLFFDLDPNVYYAQEGNLCGSGPSLPSSFSPLIVENVATFNNSSTIRPQSYVGSNRVSIHGSIEEQTHKDETRTLLVRRYVEAISPWLDVFDHGKYFGHMVPIRARHSRLLKECLLAVAAKQFSNSKANTHSDVTQLNSFTSPGSRCSNSTQLDWSYEAASFYDSAIQTIISSLQFLALPVCEELSTREFHPQQEDSRDLIAALPILLVYEMMDNHHTTMIQHLSGAQRVLQKILERQEFSAGDSGCYAFRDKDLQRSWEASFWNLVFFDYITSYTARSQTRFGITEVDLWNVSGLPLKEINGVHIPKSLVPNQGSYQTDRMTETMACRTLLWVLLRVSECIANGSRDSSEPQMAGLHPLTGLSPSVTSGVATTSWDNVAKYLHLWHSSLPDSFEPCFEFAGPPASRTAPTVGSHISFMDSEHPKKSFPEIFIANPSGAIALLLYHSSQLIVLLNGPEVGKSLTVQTGLDRIRTQRHFLMQTRYHCETICGIATSAPQASLHMHLPHALHVAGICLDVTEQRSIIIALLIDLERQSGIVTAWLLSQLKEAWV